MSAKTGQLHTLLRAWKAEKACGPDRVAREAFVKAKGWPDRHEILQVFQKAGSVESFGSGAPWDFARGVADLSVPGRIPGARRLPPRRTILSATSRPRGFVVAEGTSIPVAGSYAETSITEVKVAAMLVASNEALRDSGLEDALAADLTDAVLYVMNGAFALAIDSAATLVDASVTSLTELDTALKAAMANLTLVAGLRDAAWFLPSWLAGRLALVRGTGGSPAYPQIGAAGGFLAGLPALVFDDAYADTDFSGSIRLVAGPQLAFSEGPAELATAPNATIELGAAPTGDSTTPAASSATLVSMFDTDCSALRAVMRAGWAVRRTGAAQLISGIVL